MVLVCCCACSVMVCCYFSGYVVVLIDLFGLGCFILCYDGDWLGF